MRSPIDDLDGLLLGPELEPWIDIFGDPILEIDLADYWEFGLMPDPWENFGREHVRALSFWTLFWTLD